MAANKIKRIVWNKLAVKQFADAIAYIRSDSPQNAEKVKEDLLKEIEKLIAAHAIFSPDKYKLNNDGNYRAFEKFKFRVSYYVAKEEIRILRIRHTRRRPLSF
jgi:plasmid stabilization system protein ParE